MGWLRSVSRLPVFPTGLPLHAKGCRSGARTRSDELSHPTNVVTLLRGVLGQRVFRREFGWSPRCVGWHNTGVYDRLIGKQVDPTVLVQRVFRRECGWSELKRMAVERDDAPSPAARYHLCMPKLPTRLCSRWIVLLPERSREAWARNMPAGLAQSWAGFVGRSVHKLVTRRRQFLDGLL
jgi:hypothetical protein